MSVFLSDAVAEVAQTTNAVPQAGATSTTTASTQVAGATAASPAEPNPIMGLMPLFLIAVVFYVLMIRPQQKKYKEHQQLVNNIVRGDRVVTSGGLIGKVSKVEADVVFVDVADAVTVQIARHAISSVVDKNGAPKKADVKEVAKTVDADTAKKSGKKVKVANDN